MQLLRSHRLCSRGVPRDVTALFQEATDTRTSNLPRSTAWAVPYMIRAQYQVFTLHAIRLQPKHAVKSGHELGFQKILESYLT